MRVQLALDLGTNTGWAGFYGCGDGGMFLHGAWNFTAKRGESPALRVPRFRDKLKELFASGTPDIVFYEQVHRHNGVEAAHVYGALKAAMQEVCEAAGVPYKGIGVNVWKKHFTGKGNAPKQRVMEVAFTRDFKPSSFDEADAIGILSCGMETPL